MIYAEFASVVLYGNISNLNIWIQQDLKIQQAAIGGSAITAVLWNRYILKLVRLTN